MLNLLWGVFRRQKEGKRRAYEGKGGGEPISQWGTYKQAKTTNFMVQPRLYIHDAQSLHLHVATCSVCIWAYHLFPRSGSPVPSPHSTGLQLSITFPLPPQLTSPGLRTPSILEHAEAPELPVSCRPAWNEEITRCRRLARFPLMSSPDFCSSSPNRAISHAVGRP